MNAQCEVLVWREAGSQHLRPYPKVAYLFAFFVGFAYHMRLFRPARELTALLSLPLRELHVIQRQGKKRRHGIVVVEGQK